MCSAGEIQPSHTIAGYRGFPRCYEPPAPTPPALLPKAGWTSSHCCLPSPRVGVKATQSGQRKGYRRLCRKGVRLNRERDGGVQGRPGWLLPSPHSEHLAGQQSTPQLLLVLAHANLGLQNILEKKGSVLSPLDSDEAK